MDSLLPYWVSLPLYATIAFFLLSHIFNFACGRFTDTKSQQFKEYQQTFNLFKVAFAACWCVTFGGLIFLTLQKFS